MLLGITTLVCAAVFAGTVAFAFFMAPDSGLVAPARNGAYTSATSSDPVRIEIPRLSIEAGVEFVGLTLRGTMGAPSAYADAGWYGYGTTPGQLGSAVIDGHVDNGFGLPGVFARLHEIHIGDSVYVVTRAGQRLHFSVTGIEVYPYDDAPTDLIFGRVDAARLNLITCDGSWDHAGDTYKERLVVFTQLRP